MSNQKGIKILMFVGLAISVAALFVGYLNIKKSFSYVEAEGIISGFHSHGRRTTQYPNVKFFYKGDSVFSKIDYYSSGMEVGQTVTVIFPPNEPKRAEIKSSLWFVPLFMLFFSLFFILPYILTIKSNEKKTEVKIK
jgi:Protein of unknown function (DUF3592)